MLRFNILHLNPDYLNTYEYFDVISRKMYGIRNQCSNRIIIYAFKLNSFFNKRNIRDGSFFSEMPTDGGKKSSCFSDDAFVGN